MAPGYSESSIAKLKSFYIRKDEENDDNLGQDIADELNSRGYKTYVGTSASAPARVDAVISYADKWVWDITKYMFSLELRVSEPRFPAVYAIAKTTRSSLARKSQKVMVQETVAKLLDQ